MFAAPTYVSADTNQSRLAKQNALIVRTHPANRLSWAHSGSPPFASLHPVDENRASAIDRAKLMQALDEVNDRWTLLRGSSGMTQGSETWGMPPLIRARATRLA